MSNYDNGFARAQRQYDAQMPREYPDDNEGKYHISGSVVKTEEAVAMLKDEGIDFEIIGDDGPEREYLGFDVESDWMEIGDATNEYDGLMLRFQPHEVNWDADNFETRFVDDDDGY